MLCRSSKDNLGYAIFGWFEEYVYSGRNLRFACSTYYPYFVFSGFCLALELLALVAIWGLPFSSVVCQCERARPHCCYTARQSNMFKRDYLAMVYVAPRDKLPFALDRFSTGVLTGSSICYARGTNPTIGGSTASGIAMNYGTCWLYLYIMIVTARGHGKHLLVVRGSP